ncbi:MAG: glycoside hydrolase family 15 protein [Gammaproteobacteria bacterium]
MTQALEQWLDHEYRHAAVAMMASVSAVGLVKERPGFGQSRRPAAGSIIASPVPGAYDPDPDYFFHWFRDSAVVIDAVRLLYGAGRMGEEAIAHFADFVRFSLSLESLDGRALVAEPAWREKVTPDFQKYVRPNEELETVRGSAVSADTRVNPDGTIDISKWARPQHDGPPLRALAVLKWMRTLRARGASLGDAPRLLQVDLAFTAKHWREPSFDIWEEESGHHYYTLRVSAAALSEGAEWLRAGGQSTEADALQAEAQAIQRMLDGFWLESAGYYRSRVLPAGAKSTKELDIAVILSAVHTAGPGDVHTARDPRMQATLERLEALFGAMYPINHQLPKDRAPAMGRYQGDVYYSGGAYYFSTFGASEFCFLAAAAYAPGREERRKWVEHGDGFLATTRAFTPTSGDLSEQFDQRTGEQTSAKHLAWSYAALISCVTARQAVAAR